MSYGITLPLTSYYTIAMVPRNTLQSRHCHKYVNVFSLEVGDSRFDSIRGTESKLVKFRFASLSSLGLGNEKL